jgi:hypothetical protein
VNGSDTVHNGLSLSGTAHWMFDRGLISYDGTVSSLSGCRLDACRHLRRLEQRPLLSLFQDVARDHPSGCGSICPLFAFARKFGSLLHLRIVGSVIVSDRAVYSSTSWIVQPLGVTVSTGRQMSSLSLHSGSASQN